MYSTKSIFNNYTETILMAPSFNPTPHSQTLFIENYRADIFGAAGIKMIYSIINNFDLRLEQYYFNPINEFLKIIIKKHF